MNGLESPEHCSKILVADDGPDELFATARILSQAGYIVEQACSAREAIDKARRTIPDLILMDVVMPEMDGLTACKCIKADPELREVFVVLLSSVSNTPDLMARGLDAGADGFISRPFHNTEFLARISSLLRIKRSV